MGCRQLFALSMALLRWTHFYFVYFKLDNPSFKRIHAVHQPWFAWMIERLCVHKRTSVHTSIIFCMCAESRERKNCNKNISRIKPIKFCQVLGWQREKSMPVQYFNHRRVHRTYKATASEQKCISLWHKFTWFHHDYESFNFSLTFYFDILLLRFCVLISLYQFCLNFFWCWF